jgi:hypothetical protein
VILDELKRVIARTTPDGITREGQLTFTFESLAASAESQGVELKSKRKTYAMLREMGFTDTNSAGDRRMAASWQIIMSIVVPAFLPAAPNGVSK